MTKCLSQYLGQSSAPPTLVLDFRFVAPFRKEKSKIEAKSQTFDHCNNYKLCIIVPFFCTRNFTLQRSPNPLAAFQGSASRWKGEEMWKRERAWNKMKRGKGEIAPLPYPKSALDPSMLFFCINLTRGTSRDSNLPLNTPWLRHFLRHIMLHQLYHVINCQFCDLWDPCIFCC